MLHRPVGLATYGLAEGGVFSDYGLPGAVLDDIICDDFGVVFSSMAF